MKRTLLSFGLTLTLLASYACKQSAPASKPADTTGNIKVGLYADLSGQTSALGQAAKNGIEMAKDEINQAGGIGGRQLELLAEDDKGQADGASAAVSRLIDQNQVSVVVGEVGRMSSAAAVSKAQGSKVPLITLTSTNPKVAQAGDYVFNLGYSSSFQGEAMAKYAANNLKAKTAAILSESGWEDGATLANSFEENFTKLGGQVVQKQSYAQTDQDFNGQLAAINTANPDVIYLPGRSAQLGNIAKQAKQAGIKATLLGGDGWNDPQVFQAGGAALDGAYITSNYSADDPSPAARKFTSDYKKRYGNQPDAVAALAYDAMQLIADALKRAGTSEPAKLRDAIAQTANFNGITGGMTINAERRLNKPALIFKLQDGKAYPIYKEESQPTTVPPPPAANTSNANATGFLMRLCCFR